MEYFEVYFVCRDGVDKVLKIFWYFMKLLLVLLIVFKDLEVYGRLKDFDVSVGSSWKVFWLGKFI